MNKPQLIAPAGDWPSLVTACENGADAVYFGIKGMNMRNYADNFDILELDKVMDFLREHKKKGYLALNTIVLNKELNKVKKILTAAAAARVDAIILWDMAVLAMARELSLPVHISTQASVSNFQALKFFHQAGAQRVVLARECTLKDIKQIISRIKKEKINCGIETFIHGAMCVSVSGRCFLSTYTAAKSANRGQCEQFCRREYQIRDTNSDAEYVLGRDYVLSAKDLCAVEFLDKLIEAGIDAFKIEGRMRSAEYLNVTVSAYRQALDAFYDGKLTSSLKANLKEKLGRAFNRGFSSGFYFGKPTAEFSRKNENMYEKLFLGEVLKFYKKINVAEVKLRTRPLKAGQEILFIGKKTPAQIVVASELQQEHAFVHEAKKGELVGIKLPFSVRPKDKVFIWQEKC
ncbi:MAG: U32 family peptidase [Candidatus Omnitrophica bacterium]|nr:U32 family peptidase [Candidatus Omnitrophota bacterium]